MYLSCTHVLRYPAATCMVSGTHEQPVGDDDRASRSGHDEFRKEQTWCATRGASGIMHSPDSAIGPSRGSLPGTQEKEETMEGQWKSKGPSWFSQDGFHRPWAAHSTLRTSYIPYCIVTLFVYENSESTLDLHSTYSGPRQLGVPTTFWYR